jgi:hypothetical protein
VVVEEAREVPSEGGDEHPERPDRDHVAVRVDGVEQRGVGDGIAAVGADLDSVRGVERLLDTRERLDVGRAQRVVGAGRRLRVLRHRLDRLSRDVDLDRSVQVTYHVEFGQRVIGR